MFQVKEKKLNIALFCEDIPIGDMELECNLCEKRFISDDCKLTSGHNVSWLCPHCNKILYYPEGASW